ncbi:hypothetical protein BH10PAT1_BH10PAT1_3340 [soil metagenome]
MKSETRIERSGRILKDLKNKYPGKDCFDVDGGGTHFAAEVEPTKEHPEYDRAVEVVISTKPHKHHKMTQEYTIISGVLELHDGEKIIILNQGDKHTVFPENIHWAKSINGECWMEVYSKPGWTREDHILV